jgi:hypothetical protein
MIQVIKYKCCGNIFAACLEPDCYTDSDWLKSLKKYVKVGHKVEMVDSEKFKFGQCQCQETPTPKTETPDLFSSL